MPDDLLRLAADLTRAGVAARGKAARVVTKAGFDAVAIMQAEEPVDTGAMRNSTGVDLQAGGTLTAVVGPTVFYAPFVAWGTSRMPPNPFDLRTAQRIGPVFEAAMAAVGADLL